MIPLTQIINNHFFAFSFGNHGMKMRGDHTNIIIINSHLFLLILLFIFIDTRMFVYQELQDLRLPFLGDIHERAVLITMYPVLAEIILQYNTIKYIISSLA